LTRHWGIEPKRARRHNAAWAWAAIVALAIIIVLLATSCQVPLR